MTMMETVPVVNRPPLPGADWQTMASAPKSQLIGGYIRRIYILGFAPELSATDPMACMITAWWEPGEPLAGVKGRWQSDGADYLYLAAWIPLHECGSALVDAKFQEGGMKRSLASILCVLITGVIFLNCVLVAFLIARLFFIL